MQRAIRSRGATAPCLMTLTFAVALSGCVTTPTDCGVPRPSRAAIREMLEENRKARHPDERPDLPAVYDWHRDVFRACDWGA